MFSVPQGPLVLEVIKSQEIFVRSVSSEVSNLLVFRLEKNQRWEESLRWRESDVSPKIYEGTKSYISHLEESRLCVCLYNGTPFLETFAANYPTLLCWDPKYTELNELARPYFNLLKEAGILYDTPESAASMLNEIYENPMSWWGSPKVQDARSKFCDRFARTSDDLVVQWKEELLKLIHEG